MNESLNEGKQVTGIEEIRDALVGIKVQLEDINKTMNEIKVIVDRNSKRRIIPLIERKTIA